MLMIYLEWVCHNNLVNEGHDESYDPHPKYNQAVSAATLVAAKPALGDTTDQRGVEHYI